MYTCNLCGGIVLDSKCVGCGMTNPAQGSKYEIVKPASFKCELCGSSINHDTVNYIHIMGNVIAVCDACSMN